MNDYDDLITQSLQPEPAQAARIGFAAAVDTNPEAYAEARRVAKRTGVPVDTAFNLPQEMKRQDRVGSMDFDRLAAMSPATAAILADVDQAKIAHDNVDSFSGIEGVLTALGGAAKYAVSAPGAARGGFASDVGRAGSAGLSGLQGASAGVVGLAQAPFDMAAPLADPLVGRVLPGNPLRATAEGLARYRQSIEAQAKASMPRAEGLVESGVFSGLASLARNMAALPLLFLPGGQPAAMAAMTAPVGGQAYGEARDKGVGVVPSLTFGASQAAIEYATEKFPVSRLLGDVRAGSSLLKTLGHQAALEVPGEQIATVLQDLNEWAVLHPEKPFSSYLEERPSAAAQTLIATLVGVGGNVAVMRGIDSVITGDEEKARRAQASEQQAQLLQQLTDLAKADKVLARDPETFEQFVASAAEGGPATQVFIDAQTLMQSGMAEQLAAVSPAVAAQLPQALQVGGQIAIPVQEYASRIAPTEYAQSLIDHIKTDPEGFSRAEAQQFMDTRADELKQQVEQALQEQEGDSTFKQSADAVRANVKTQLDTAGRFTPQANDAYAAMVGSFYAVQSAKLGMTPEALFERYPLRVVAESVVDGQQFDQALATQPPKGWAHSTTGQDAAKLWGAPKGDTNAVFWTDLQGKLAQDAPELAGYSHSVDRSRVDHIRKNHGNEAAEASRGQVAVTGADVARIPEIVTSYDAIDTNVSVPAEVGPEKVRGVVFAKQYEDGTVVYTGLVSSKRQNVRGATLWKYPPSVDAQTAVKRAVAKLTSETYGGMDGIVGPAGETLNQAARGSFNPSTNTIALLKAADLSTFLHETGHFFLEVQMDMASRLQHEADAFGGETNGPDESQILADARTVLDWFGIQSLAEWHNLDFEERRAHHENFARGFEAYLFEGKAPSIELQGLFQRFRAWLVAVYKNFKALNVELTPEVRSVFDRMLATSEEIALAEQGRSMMPLFATPDQAGMTPEAFAAYQALGVDATNTATDELQARGLRDMQWLHNARGRMLKRLQREAKDLRAEAQIDARREVMRQPVYQAWQLLSGRIAQDEAPSEDGAPSAARLDLAALSGLGVPAEVVALLKERKMTAQDGLHPDVAAELILTAEGQAAFTSGDEMVRALAEAIPPREAIENLTDLLMLERHGDLATPEAIERAADQAIHNDVRARLLATEANALAKATGESRVLSYAAKTFAADMIARLQVRAVRTGQYAGAEVRAAKASERAAKAGDLAQAAAEKRNQLIQHHATRAAHNALDEIDRGLRYLKKFDGDIKSLDADYAEQIANLLERFDLRKGQSLKAVDKRTALAQWLATQREAGLEPDIPAQLENEAYRTSYKNLTVEEFRGLVDTVRQIEHLGRLKNKLLTAADQRSYQAARDEIAAGIAEHAQGRQADTRTPTTNAGRAVQGLKRFWAAHIKVATWARVMDGGKDGGPVWEYFLRSANERGDMETTMRAEATARLAEIMAPVFALGKMGGKGQFFPSIKRSLNRESRIAIALNMGNEGNIQRLLGGEGWTRAQIGPVLQSLTAQEWQTVQAVWDHFESYRPQIAAKELRVYGKEPAWVEPSPLAITTQDGQTLSLRGGYYPIKYDPAASQRAEQHADAEGAKRQMQGAYTTATTRRSFTKARVEEVSGRPLLYTLSGMYGGVNDVIHDLAWHEWLIDANRLLRSNTIDTVIREHYGPEVKQQFKSWVQDVAEGEKGSDAAVDQALSRLRQGVSAAGLGFNVVSALIQPLGLTQSITRVGVGWIGRGVARYIAHPLDLARDINGRSAFMENRARTRFRELNELRNQVQDQSAFNEYVGRYAYFLMMRCQQVVDLPTWWGAYEKATAEGNDENRAVALADQAVIDAQGGGQTKDLSAMERGGPAQRLFTVYYSFMNTALNLGVAQTMTADTAAKKGKLAVDYAMLYVVPAVLGYFLKNAITPGDSGDDDWEKIAKKLLANQIDYLMGLMVVVREFGEAAKTVSGANDMGRDYTGPAGLRLVSDTGTLAKQVHQGEFDTAFRKAAI
ncbi:hypothetical protein, partial [Acidovorax sp.]|uniref:PBECR3 domain-containing polyvalent protein n=1 Tax=Acidovorax sp. TaxID=1872122 RepID=UPI0025C07C52